MFLLVENYQIDHFSRSSDRLGIFEIHYALTDPVARDVRLLWFSGAGIGSSFHCCLPTWLLACREESLVFGCPLVFLGDIVVVFSAAPSVVSEVACLHTYLGIMLLSLQINNRVKPLLLSARSRSIVCQLSVPSPCLRRASRSPLSLDAPCLAQPKRR